MSRRPFESPAPMSWLHVAGFVIVLWAASSDVLAQARDVLVTEVRGNAVRVSGGAPLRALDTLKPGERVRLSSDSQAGFFTTDNGQLYVVDGPAEVTVVRSGVLANGKNVAARRLDDAYRTIRAGSAELAQGSMVMRSARDTIILAPEGVVTPDAARRFLWQGDEGWNFELAKDSGELVHRAEVSGGRIELPASVTLEPGVKYVWGLSRPRANSGPADWTEFRIADSVPTASDRVVHALWLRESGMPRAALRTLRTSR